MPPPVQQLPSRGVGARQKGLVTSSTISTVRQKGSVSGTNGPKKKNKKAKTMNKDGADKGISSPSINGSSSSSNSSSSNSSTSNSSTSTSTSVVPASETLQGVRRNSRIALTHRGRFFVEMDELEYIDTATIDGRKQVLIGETSAGGELTATAEVPIFVESAHWVRGFEQDVVYDEFGKESFSKPRAGAGTLHGFFALRRELARGCILLDVDEIDAAHIADVIIAEVMAKELVPMKHKQSLLAALMAHHHHTATKERHAMLMSRKHRREKEIAARKAEADKKALKHSSVLGSFSFRASSVDRATETKHSSKPSNKHLDAEETKEELEEGPSEESLLNDPDPDSLDHDDDAFDVLVGGTPFLERILTVFVRLKEPQVVGDFSEEGYRTKHIFLCLGSKAESEEVWEIGRSCAVLMSQEAWGEKIDSAQSGTEIMEIIELAEQLDSFRAEVGASNKRRDSFANTNKPQATDDATAQGKAQEGGPRGSSPPDKLQRQTSLKRQASWIRVDGAGKSSSPFGLLPFCGRFFSKPQQEVDEPMPIVLPLHLDQASRRMMAIQDLREESARKRRHMLQHMVSIELDADPAVRDIRFSPFLAEHHHTSRTIRWTKKQLFEVILVALSSLGILCVFLFWLGGGHPDHTGAVHHVHFVSQTAIVGGIGAVGRGAPMIHEVAKNTQTTILDVKVVAQAQVHYRRFEAAQDGDGDHHGAEDGVEAVEIMLYAFDHPRQHDKQHSKACLKRALRLEVKLHDESEMLRTIVLSEHSAAGSGSCSLKHGGFFELTTNAPQPVGVLFDADELGDIAAFRVMLSGLLLFAVYACIISDVIHRTLVAMCGAFGALLLLSVMGYRANMEATLVWMDEGTLALLFGMMILVNLVSTTGVFEWLAIRALEYSRQSLSRLLVLLCLSCGALSAFLDNVTTMLLLAPVTIELCDIMSIDPVPILISEVLFSNVGGTATMIGDPPNIIIGNLLSEYVSFLDFIINLAPCVLLCCYPTLRFLLWYNRDYLSQDIPDFDIQELKHKYAIRNPFLLAKSAFVMGSVLLLFFLHPFHHVDTSWIACVGALGLMIIATPHELRHVLEHVEWDTLLFFAALFIMIEAMAMMGLIRAIGSGVGAIIAAAPQESRLRIAICVIVWVSAIVSGFLDNIPYTATMVPVIKILSENEALDLPLKPLVWALSLGACLGGNCTIVGASANLVTAGAAGAAGHPISFRSFSHVGTPVTFITVVIANVYCIVVYDVLGFGH